MSMTRSAIETRQKIEESKANDVRAFLKTAPSDHRTYNDYLKFTKSSGVEAASRVFYGKLLKANGATSKEAPAKPVASAKQAPKKVAPKPEKDPFAGEPAKKKSTGPKDMEFFDVKTVGKTAEKPAATTPPKDVSAKVKDTLKAAGFALQDKYGNEAVEADGDEIYIMVATGDRGPRLDHGGGNGDDWMDDEHVNKLYTAAEKKWGPKAKSLEDALAKAGISAKIRVDYNEKGFISLTGVYNPPKEAIKEAKKKPIMDDEDEDGDDDFIDTDEDDGEIPPEFKFESKMIFLSNMKEIPEAVGDRCLTIGLHYTKSQALDLIQSKLEFLCPEYPELTIDKKNTIIAFMRKYQGHTARISFRSFIHIATIYMSGVEDWEKWALIQMKSMPV